ncbi:hypothetical protein [Janthinobacterium lividum]|uniref:Erythromycin esterase family protein n=1 Tax=Janthinobacterium lividum TaxID=29581 RepID=A0ABU0XMQ8_9BURK|nr:hypothetical protein [Janthinobacterium lividum]MDQ4624802.1 hypothetical protein [Janthinobacterium lividum]MDQ4673595.1 hypothetical protein [Janthinobacterium lividum]MDQ4684325.1 hypothetical protein [Janthinobacterium lividum]
MRKLRSTIIFTMLASLAMPVLSADKPLSLPDRLAALRTTIAIDHGKMVGSGAAPLINAGLESQFVLIGEDHGITEIANFSAAYFEALAGQGFTTLIVENGPAVAGALEKALKSNTGVAGIAAFNQAYPVATAFYKWQAEAQFLARIAKAAGPSFQLVGMDQELMGASKYLLDQMAEQPLNPLAKSKIEAFRKLESDNYRRASESGDPRELFMVKVQEEELFALQKLLTAPEEMPALAMLNSLIESRSIYTKNMTPGQGYGSNTQRARLMKQYVASHLTHAPAQRMLLKAGAIHVFRGYNPLGAGSREIGNYLAEYAEGRGQKSLHVLVLALKGQQAQFAGIGRASASTEIEKVDSKSSMAGVLPFFAAAKEHKEWSLFDVRPLLGSAKTLANGDSSVQGMIQGYDFVLVIPEGNATSDL